MLAESSTTTATMFCCGRKVATLSAGCHSISSSREAIKVCSNHTPTDRSEPMRLDPEALRRTQNHSPAAARITAAISDQTGQVPSSTSVPREKTAAGYLKKNSNMRCFHLHCQNVPD